MKHGIREMLMKKNILRQIIYYSPIKNELS